MNKLRMAARITPLVCLLVATTVRADGKPDLPFFFNWSHVSDWCDNFGPSVHSATSRTYFGKPGTGPYTDAPRYRNPWNVKIFGVEHCKTDADRYEKFAKRYQIMQAQHQAKLNRLNWDAYDNHMNPKPNSHAGYVGSCDCKGIYQASHASKCGKGCGSGCGGQCGECSTGCNRPIGGDLLGLFFKGKCGSACDSGCETGCDTGCGSANACDGCDKTAACGGCGKCGSCMASAHGGKGLFNKIKGVKHGKHHRYFAPYNQVGPLPYSHGHIGQGYQYPPMNPEDATRYIEGFQYYPPNHLIRSPRDFFMFDTKYGIGR